MIKNVLSESAVIADVEFVVLALTGAAIRSL